MNLFSGSVDALRSVGNSWIMSLSFIMDQQQKVIRLCVLVCCLIAVLSGEHYATQAQVMSSKALRASNTRRNGEFLKTVTLKVSGTHACHCIRKQNIKATAQMLLFTSFWSLLVNFGCFSACLKSVLLKLTQVS